MIYRKQGGVARWENGTLIRVTESGAAREDGDLFECWPEPSNHAVDEPTSRRVVEIASSLQHLPVERLIVVHGAARHEYDGRTWSEETERIHLSLAHGQLRALVDSSTRRLDDWTTIAAALQRADPHDREPPRHLVLAPGVAAAVLPFLPNATQTAGGVDGYGNDIVDGGTQNFYRPSYRVRPVRMPHNLRLDHHVTAIDPDLPRAIALLAPPDSVALRVLVIDGESVYPTTAHVTKIEAVGREREWYPYGAGSFGAELML